MRTDKLSAAAEKLRAHARTAWSHTARLRPYAAKLRPYADKLRRLVLKAVDAVGSGLHRGVVQVGRVSPRTAKRLEAAGAWVCQSEGRKLGAAGLVAVVVLGTGFAAVFSEAAGRYARVISASNRVVPLPDEIRRAAADKAKQLAAALEARIDRKGKFAGEAWISAQVLVALKESGPSRISVKSVDQYFRSVAGPECACWRRLPRGEFPNHVGVTSWSLWTLARYGIPAHRSELAFLLSMQNGEGGWPLFAGAKGERFASSYAAAAAILALHEQSTLKASRAQQERLAAAVRRGADWLKTRAADGRARWADYPAWPEASQHAEYLGLSGFVLFALHRVGAPGLAALDRDWLARLPAEAPAARESEASRRTVQVGKRSYRDDTRYAALPWAILATAAAYPDASVSEKVRAMEWLERALAPGASIYAITGKERNPTIAAEALLALRIGATRE